MTDTRDTLYAELRDAPAAFRFDDSVARVFPDMIRRSVPGYATIIAMTGLLAGRYATPGSRLYDLGCSLGASTLAMRQHVAQPGCRIVAVDNAEAMLARCRDVVAADTQTVDTRAADTQTVNTQITPVEFLCADIAQVAIAEASVVVLNFTLQFVPPEQRDAVIRGIYTGLRPGGILVLSEKVRFDDARLDALNIALHEQFKLANGYSELEVAGKRAALERVLIPETLSAHRARIAQAGFSSCDVWFQCFNFASLIALR